MAPAYEHAMGGIADNYRDLLAVAHEYSNATGATTSSYEPLERALTTFRRSEAAWK